MATRSPAPDRDLHKSYAALDRIARQEATLGKLDTAKLDACIAKQDETQVNASLKEATRWASTDAPALFVEWRAHQRRRARGTGLDGHRPRPARCRRTASALPATLPPSRSPAAKPAGRRQAN